MSDPKTDGSPGSHPHSDRPNWQPGDDDEEELMLQKIADALRDGKSERHSELWPIMQHVLPSSRWAAPKRSRCLRTSSRPCTSATSPRPTLSLRHERIEAATMADKGEVNPFDYDADAGDRIWRLLEIRNIAWRDRLRQSVDTAGAQLEWATPSLMGPSAEKGKLFMPVLLLCFRQEPL